MKEGLFEAADTMLPLGRNSWFASFLQIHPMGTFHYRAINSKRRSFAMMEKIRATTLDLSHQGMQT